MFLRLLRALRVHQAWRRWWLHRQAQLHRLSSKHSSFYFVNSLSFQHFMSSQLSFQLKVVTNLTSDCRRAEALLNFRDSPLQKVILNGSRDNKVFWPNAKELTATTISNTSVCYCCCCCCCCTMIIHLLSVLNMGILLLLLLVVQYSSTSGDQRSVVHNAKQRVQVVLRSRTSWHWQVAHNRRPNQRNVRSMCWIFFNFVSFGYNYIFS